MKTEIKYKASAEITKHIHDWLSWIKFERNYSVHTIDAYSRDLSIFFEFWSDYLGNIPQYKDLQEIDVKTFRAFLSKQNSRQLTKTSI